MPANTVYVGRPTKWGNPYPMECVGTIEVALALYRRFLAETEIGAGITRAARAELRGKDLACWCRMDQPCHADILLDVANS